jgi:hypothetical protein
MNTSIQLSEAEIKLIEANRLKLEARKLEVEAEDANAQANELLDRKKGLTEEVNEANLKYHASMDFYRQLFAIDNKVTMSVKDETISRDCYYYKKNYDENFDKYKSEHVKLDTILTEKVSVVSITYCGYKIIVERHKVYSGNGFRARPTSNDFEMRINGSGLEYKEGQKFLKRPATVIAKIKEVIEIAERKVQQAAQLKDVVGITKEKYAALYPTATIKVEESYDRIQISYNKYQNEKLNLMTIKFENGVEVKYKIYSDGSLGRKGISFGELKQEQILQALSTIEKPVKA